MNRRILHLTPQSHFSRKVRIVLAELGLEYECAYAPDLLSRAPSDFGGNPILRVPVLEDGEEWVVESDAITRYLLETYDGGRDRFHYFGMTPPQRNALSILSAIMGAEVELILSQRSGIGADEGRLYFARYRGVIRHGLSWIEEHAAALWPPADFSYLDVALICMWDHLRYNMVADGLEACSWIAGRTAKFRMRPSVAATSPEKMEELQWKLYPSQRPKEARGKGR